MKEKSGQDQTSKEPENQHAYVPFSKLYIFATWFDYLLMTISVIAAAGAGAALPVMSIIFGSMVTVMTDFQTGVSTSEEFMQEISKYALYFIYIGIGVFLCTYIFMSTSILVSEKLGHRMREAYLKAVLHMDIAWFDNLGAGEITTRITNDTNLFQDGVGEKVTAVVQDTATFLSGLIIALATEWRLALAVCCIIPVIIVSATIINIFAGRCTAGALDEYSKAGTLAEEAIVSIRTAIAFNQQKKLGDMYRNFMNRAEAQGRKKVYIVGTCVGSIFLAIYCGYAIAFYYGGQLINWGIVDSGKVVNVFFAILIGAFSIANIPPNLQAVTFARGAASKLLAAIEYQPLINSESTEGARLSMVEGRLKFNNVAFHYPSRPDVPIFEDFSLDIKAGTTVALVGASGSGKSTTIQLLERFYDPVSGTVTIDDNDITKLNLKWYRQQLGLVSQEPTLFGGTIADNVALGLIGTEQEHFPREQQMNTIMEACRKANAHTFISELPLGYNTQVGERGFLLSGGQKQRIAIARAIVKDPRILLLDEATSALDTKSEGIVQEALDRASEGRTTIVIAHRLSTVKNADVIVVMEKGKVLETGNHRDLMAIEDGAYKNLITLQEVRSKANELEMDAAAQIIPDSQEEMDIITRMNTVSTNLTTATNIEEGVTSTFNTPLYKLIADITKLNRPETPWILLGTLGATVLGLIYPIFAIIFANLLQAFTKTGQALLDETSFWALMFFILAICAGLGQLGSQWGFGMASEKLSTTLRTSSFNSILRQEVGWFDRNRNSAGALVTSLSQDAQDIQGLSGVTFGSILNIVINLISCVIVGLVYGWKLALVVIACLPLILYSGYLRVAMIRKFQLKNKEAYAHSAEMACENAAAMRTVASLTKENSVLKQYSVALEIPLQAGYKNALISSVMYAVSLSTNFFVNALVFWYGGTLLSKHEYELQNFFTVFMALLVGASGAARVFAFAPDMNKARDAAASLFYLNHREPHIDSSEDGPGRKMIAHEEKPALQGHVRFENIHFHYPTRPGAKVLRGVDFEVKPGQFVALVGASGCGKSTSIGLLERFYDVTKGRVLVDGSDVRDYHLPSYRDNIALVGQEPALYDLSIKDNILFGARTYGVTPTYHQIEEAAKAANIHDFIMSLPQGYETRVGGKGSQLSGGQKQRIAIARALIRDPTILLLDEATSALDAESEKIVQAALDKAAAGRTTLAIAHRLSSIQHADLILVFSAGHIVERGTHDQLLNKGGVYYEMAQQQILDHP